MIDRRASRGKRFRSLTLMHLGEACCGKNDLICLLPVREGVC